MPISTPADMSRQPEWLRRRCITAACSRSVTATARHVIAGMDLMVAAIRAARADVDTNLTVAAIRAVAHAGRSAAGESLAN